MSTAGPQPLVLKVIVVGEIGTGKTSIIKRYISGTFSLNYKATVGVDFGLKELDWENETKLKVQLWDIAGQERFGSMTRVYYRDAVGALVVFDVKRESTLEAVKKWKSDIDAKVHLPSTETPIPCLLMANKIDLVSADDESWAATKKSMDKFCQDNGFVAWFETSAKVDIGIEPGVNTLVKAILSRVNKTDLQDKDDMKDIVDPSNNTGSSGNSSCSCVI